MLNEPRQSVTTYPDTEQVVTTPGEVVTCMIGHWYALNVLYHMYYNYTGVLWNIQRRLQPLQLQQLILTKKLTNSATFVRLDEVTFIYSWPSWKMAAILDFRLTNLTEWI